MDMASGESRNGDAVVPPTSSSRDRRKLNMAAASPRRTLAPSASPAPCGHPSRRRRGQGLSDGAVPPLATSGGSCIPALGGAESDPGGKGTPLPPLGGGKPGAVPVDGRELSGKARKLARIAQTGSTVGVSPAMSFHDLLAISFAGDSGAPGHDGAVGAGADGKPKRRSGGSRPNLRLTRSFSHIDESRMGRSAVPKLESPALPNRGIASKARGSNTPQPMNGRVRNSQSRATASRRTWERGARSKLSAQKSSLGASSASFADDGGDAGGDSDTARHGGVSVGGTPAHGRDSVSRVLPTELRLGIPAPTVEAPGPQSLSHGRREGAGAGPGAGAGAGGGGGGPPTFMNTAVGAEAVVRDTLYNSHGIVALDGYLWKPGAIRVVRRWMMLVDNSLYYFVRPG